MHDDRFIRHFEKSLTVLRRIVTGYHSQDSGDSFSRTQLDILTLIDDKANQTIKDLAKQLAMTSGAITQTVETLIRRNLISKVQSEHDRRFSQLTLTESGQKAINKYYQVRAQMLRVFMDELSDAEIEAILNIAKKMTVLDIKKGVNPSASSQAPDLPGDMKFN